jgi:hypothetical protein
MNMNHKGPGNRKPPVSVTKIQTPEKRSRSSHEKTNSSGKKKAQLPNSAGKKKAQSANVFIASHNNDEPSTPHHLMQGVISHNDANTPAAEEENKEEDHHKNLFNEQFQLYYCYENERKLIEWKQLNNIIEIVKGDASHMKGDSRQATLYYKYKTDFAVHSFGDHYSLVKAQHVVGKSVIDISTVPRYACDEESLRKRSIARYASYL